MASLPFNVEWQSCLTNTKYHANIQQENLLGTNSVAKLGIVQEIDKIAPSSLVLGICMENACHEIHETCNSVTFYFMKKRISVISRKCSLPNMMRARWPNRTKCTSCLYILYTYIYINFMK